MRAQGDDDAFRDLGEQGAASLRVLGGGELSERASGNSEREQGR